MTFQASDLKEHHFLDLCDEDNNLLWDTLDTNNFCFILFYFSDFILNLCFFSFLFLFSLDDEEGT